MTQPAIWKVESHAPDSIEIGPRHRGLNEAAVDMLVASIDKIGLRTPISVRYYDTRPEWMPAGETDDCLVLLTGRHRLEAVRRLGWQQIDCVIHYEGDEIDAELWEIAENLHRAELTVLERDVQVARWIELNKQRIVTSCDSSRPGPKGAERAAAKELGIGRMGVNRAVKVASLSDEAMDAAREVGLDDNRTALLAAAAAEPEKQATIIRDYAERKTVNQNKIDGDVQARAAREVAEWLAEKFPADEWDALKANLYAAKDARRIANELTNIAGQSIMDRRYG